MKTPNPRLLRWLFDGAPHGPAWLSAASGEGGLQIGSQPIKQRSRRRLSAFPGRPSRDGRAGERTHDPVAEPSSPQFMRPGSNKEVTCLLRRGKGLSVLAVPVVWRPRLKGRFSSHFRHPSEGGCHVSSEISMKLFVGGLSWDTNDTSLRNAFEAFGEVTDSKVITDRETGRSRGFGFVTFSSADAAKTAMAQMDGQPIDGRTVRVNEAQAKGGGRGGNRGGGGGGRW